MSLLLDRLLFFRKNVGTFAGDLGVRVREEGSDELTDLARAFNAQRTRQLR